MPTTHYIWDEVTDSLLAEVDENGEIIVEYTVMPQPFGRVISERRGGKTLYHEYDALGNTRQLTDESGNVTDTFVFDAFGDIVSRTGTNETPLLWHGEWGYYFDAEIGLYQVRQRPVQPETARWTSPDPSSPIQGDYKYAANSPVLRLDPSGLLDFMEDVYCKSRLGEANLGLLEAFGPFFHRTRGRVNQDLMAASPSTKANANGVGIRIYFYKNETACANCCTRWEFIQAITISANGKSFTYIDACGALPYYGHNPGSSTPDYGPHKVPDGYPGAGQQINSTLSLYDRPFGRGLVTAQDDVLLAAGNHTKGMNERVPQPPFKAAIKKAFTSCVICKRTALPDLILEPCAQWGFEYTFDAKAGDPVVSANLIQPTSVSVIALGSTGNDEVVKGLRTKLWGAAATRLNEGLNCKSPEEYNEFLDFVACGK